MKKLNKSGFTLIELLAVIVVLAIVAVLATSQLLPILEKTRKNAFAAEANNVIDAASKAVTLWAIGDKTDTEISSSVTGGGDQNKVFCFTLQKLVEDGVLVKDLNKGNYSGTVVVTVPPNSGAYTYRIEMQNTQFYVQSTGTASADDVYTGTPATEIKTSCQ